MFVFSGESAFHAMMTGFGWAKNPIINRMDLLRKDVPITLIYGSRSWVDNSASDKIKEIRSGTSYVNVIVSIKILPCCKLYLGKAFNNEIFVLGNQWSRTSCLR